mmetsp:Transcript_52185/g.111091  ORF Transcript_52185/g.111091 Transcript_52185/m.111091 type:complete len:121 (-) Transcript_52185:1573-1935(-)
MTWPAEWLALEKTHTHIHTDTRMQRSSSQTARHRQRDEALHLSCVGPWMEEETEAEAEAERKKKEKKKKRRQTSCPSLPPLPFSSLHCTAARKTSDAHLTSGNAAAATHWPTRFICSVGV